MPDSERKKLIIITGPTASGKSDVSVELALRLGGMVVSADSVQIYKGMDIGSAKMTRDEMRGVSHFLIDSIEPDEGFNVSEFVSMAEETIGKIYDNGALPVIAGGTAFYIQALLKGVEFSDDTGADEEIRHDAGRILTDPGKETWRDFFSKHFAKCSDRINADGLYKGIDSLYALLGVVDPVSCDIIHKNNHKRIIRALEYFKATGEPFSEYNKREAARKSEYDFSYFVLTDDREKLYERINERVDRMIAAGLEGEVRRLKAAGYSRDLPSMKSIGYKEMYAYIEGECSLDKAVYEIKKNTRHFAKRQMTWFRREPDVITVDIAAYGYKTDRIVDEIIRLLQKKDGESK